MNNEKKKKIVINDKVWLLISLCAALLVWYLLSLGKSTGRSFPFVEKVVPSVGTMIERGAFWKDIGSSMFCVAAGFGLGFVTALPIAFLMAWYQPVQKIIEPWINFIRNIPALGYAPLLVIIFGVGQKPAIILIWICTFMTMIKAARVLGANDFDRFMKIICPATVPFIITAVRLGLGAALTTLLAAESTGAQAGIGMRIRSLSNSFEAAPMLMYIILLGIIGLILVKMVDIIERKLTGWQEKIN